MLARALAVLMIGLGVAILIRTAALGGSGVAYGYLLGGLLVFAGALRLYLSAKLTK
ncbi:MAG: hypothetical protein AABM30_09130 [Actinomycetota bacterium]